MKLFFYTGFIEPHIQTQLQIFPKTNKNILTVKQKIFHILIQDESTNVKSPRVKMVAHIFKSLPITDKFSKCSLSRYYFKCV